MLACVVEQRAVVSLRDGATSPALILRIGPTVDPRDMRARDGSDVLKPAKFGDHGVGWRKAIIHADNICDNRELLSSHLRDMRDRLVCEERKHAEMVDSPSDPKEWLRGLLDAAPRGTKSRLADHLKVKPDAITRMVQTQPGKETRKIEAGELLKIAEFFDVPAFGLQKPPPTARTAVPIPTAEMPKDVPVMGNAVGGKDADFFLNGEITDHVRRPPGIARTKGVFAIYVVGDSMFPRFAEGELIYATSTRRPVIGDDVIVELYPAHEGAQRPGFLKRMVKQTPTKLIVSQFNPRKTIEFELRRIKAIHRVIPWTELLGS